MRPTTLYETKHVIHHAFIPSKSLSLSDNAVPASFPVLIRLWVERHGPGQEVNPANDLVDDEKDVASDNQESDSCFKTGKIIQYRLLFITVLKPKQKHYLENIYFVLTWPYYAFWDVTFHVV